MEIQYKNTTTEIGKEYMQQLNTNKSNRKEKATPTNKKKWIEGIPICLCYIICSTKNINK